MGIIRKVVFGAAAGLGLAATVITAENADVIDWGVKDYLAESPENNGSYVVPRAELTDKPHHFSNQFVCAVKSGGDITSTNTVIADWDLKENADMAKTDYVVGVFLGASVLTGHHADPIVNKDDSLSEPIGFCLTKNGYKAPMFKQS